MSWRWQAAAGALLVVVAGVLALRHYYQQPPPAPPAVAPSRTAVPAQASSPGVARSVPDRLMIPAIGLDAPVESLGLNPDHTIQVPDVRVAGWYKLGPSPGQQGSAVIIGHVDSYRGPAVFFRLRSLQPGNRVLVRLADGVTVRFVVLRVAMYAKTAFPSLLVYGPHGYAALQLVTCGGVFDRTTGSYLSNVVVFASLLSSG